MVMVTPRTKSERKTQRQKAGREGDKLTERDTYYQTLC